MELQLTSRVAGHQLNGSAVGHVDQVGEMDFFSVIRNMTGTQRNRHRRGNQVQTHETDPGEPPKRLRAPGMHRVPSGDLLANAVEDFGGGGALCRRAEQRWTQLLQSVPAWRPYRIRYSPRPHSVRSATPVHLLCFARRHRETVAGALWLLVERSLTQCSPVSGRAHAWRRWSVKKRSRA